MLILLAPSKTQRFSAEPALPAGLEPTLPALLDDASRLAAELSRMSEEELARRMKVSETIAVEAAQRYARWSASRHERDGHPALLAYTGEAFRGFDVGSLTDAEVADAQRRLRILSALYGVLRPFDRIMPHRLDLGDRFAPGNRRSIAAFWDDRPTREIAQATGGAGGAAASPRVSSTAGAAPGAATAVVSLASKEYARLVRPELLPVPLVTVSFHEQRGGALRAVGMYAKNARGRLARWIVRNRVDDPAALRAFDADGYRFREDLSGATEYVFVRASE